MTPDQITIITSGGQTGADRAAFDFALENNIEIRGFVPQNRMAEDGPISDRYPNLTETASNDPAERTRLNVQASDATLIVSHGELTGGTRLTREFAEQYHKPHLHLDFSKLGLEEAAATAKSWLNSVECRSLNIAGPRASTDPAIYRKTKALLARIFSG